MSAVERVRAAYAAIARAGRPEIWITLRPRAQALDEAAAIDARVAAGERLPLAGLLAGVKDNIDVAGLPTTAAAPSYAYLPERDATSVARLRAAGAVVIGKTNLDQFATGLAGTRSPYGAVRNAFDPARISGGSSSGSGVAVALGLVDIALGTDTAGSGRVPAALNGVVGIKPTRGVIPCTGVVPACRSLDCVSVFARSLALARRAVTIMAGPDGTDPLATLLCYPRGPRRSTPLSPPSAGEPWASRCTPDDSPRLAIPLTSQLDGLAGGWAEAFEAAVARFRSAGCEVVPVDLAPLLEAATLLYGGSFVAERYAAVGAHVAANEPLIGTGLDPVVARIILDGAKPSAAEFFADRQRLDLLSARAAGAMAGFDALLTPTTTEHPTLAEVAADPVGVNSRLGRYTNFCNLLDLAALAIPAGTVAGLPFGIMLTGPAGSDEQLAQIAARYDQADVDLLVVGAHLSGQPLNHELLAAGGTLAGPADTAPHYRLFALGTTPPKPGLVRVPPDGTLIPCPASSAPGLDPAPPASHPRTASVPPPADADERAVSGGRSAEGARGKGASIAGELWRLPAAGFARFMAGLTAPMAIGRVSLADGRDVLGFLCEPAAIQGAADITGYGGWRAWREQQARTPAESPAPAPSASPGSQSSSATARGVPVPGPVPAPGEAS
jgi:allophanate hydrolase